MEGGKVVELYKTECPFQMTRSVLTIATGKKYFIDLACNLIRSFFLWNEKTDIAFWLVTDRKEFVPHELAKKINILEIRENQYGKGFETKLYLDHFAQTDQSLFIDADCLVYGNLNQVFDIFKGRSVSAIGDQITEGDFFCNIATMINQLKLPYMPRFVGGVYYLEKSPTAEKVFDFARTLKPRYDELGFIRLRGVENEEPLIALGMAKYNQKVIPEDGSIKADRMFFKYCRTNVLKGKAEFWNEGAFPEKVYFKIKQANPLIGHFNASFAENYEYNSESHRLTLRSIGLPVAISNLYSGIFILFPGKLKENLKQTLRPVYRKLFGFRSVKKSKRI